MIDLQPLLAPQSICIVGASPDTSTIRGRVLKTLLDHRYPGQVYLVSRSHTEIQGIKTYSSVADTPEAADLCVILVPAMAVAAALEDCGRRGIRAALVISAGFSEEQGDDGAQREAELKDIARRYGMALCGPNSQGFVNALANTAVTFSPVVGNPQEPLSTGVEGCRKIAVIAQSGAMSFAFLDRGKRRQLNFSHHISTGNQTVLEAHAYLEYLIECSPVDIFLLYLERFGDGAEFRRIADLAAQKGKNLIVAKPGVSEAARRAAASHTGSLAKGGIVDDAIFSHHGIIRGEDLDHMLDVAAALSFCSLPRGNRVAIVTASGASAVWMSDILAAHGLEVPLLEPEIQAEIQALLPSYGSAQNPIDVSAQAIRELGYAKLITILDRSQAIDSILMLPSLTAEHIAARDARELAQLDRQGGKPLLSCTYSAVSDQVVAEFARAGIPVYTSMPNCARALKALVEQGQRTASPVTTLAADAADDVARARARTYIEECKAGLMTEVQAKQALAQYGLAMPKEYLATSAEQARQAAQLIGGPVALKVQSADIPHKTEAGALVLNVTGDGTVADAYDMLLANVARSCPGARVDGVLVQEMVPKGREVIIGVTTDDDFGPMLMVGLGGIYTEVLKDVVFSPVPVDERRARELIGQLKGASLLDGVRGEAPSDKDALASVIAAVSRFAAENADLIMEIDLNPVMVHTAGNGVSIVDALIVKKPAASND